MKKQLRVVLALMMALCMMFSMGCAGKGAYEKDVDEFLDIESDDMWDEVWECESYDDAEDIIDDMREDLEEVKMSTKEGKQLKEDFLETLDLIEDFYKTYEKYDDGDYSYDEYEEKITELEEDMEKLGEDVVEHTQSLFEAAEKKKIDEDLLEELQLLLERREYADDAIVILGFFEETSYADTDEIQDILKDLDVVTKEGKEFKKLMQEAFELSTERNQVENDYYEGKMDYEEANAKYEELSETLDDYEVKAQEALEAFYEAAEEREIDEYYLEELEYYLN